MPRKKKLIENDLEALEELNQARKTIVTEVGKVIIGQTKVIDEVLVALLSRGHCLLIGVPGLAKTLLISTLSSILDLNFNRIQFTPDLMPSDITGTDIIEEKARSKQKEFRFLKGPIFANIILADEINRTPPKTQAALLQAMQEYAVTAGGITYDLAPPFFVLATQNPIEQEGTYPLPEAQLDRFMFSTTINYPSLEEEMEIVRTTTSAHTAKLKKVLGAKEILHLQEIIRRVPAAEHVIAYAVSLARNTRPVYDGSPSFIKDWVSWGAGPRASQYLILGGKARAALDGRSCVSCDDVRASAAPVLRHRIITNFNAEADGVDSNKIIQMLLESVKESA
ncbi:MAG: MoxR family ATPase [bacterium]|nr:MoxR family ATPase [bacterium]